MVTNKNYELVKVTISVLFCFANFATFADASHQIEKEKPNDLFTNKVNLSSNFVVEWKVLQTERCIEFNLRVVVDEKGWVLLGFMPAAMNISETPKTVQQSKGDFVVTALLSASGERKTLDLNTMKTQELVEDDNTTRMDYQVTGGNSTENSTAQVLHIIRKLDTGDPQDVNITDQAMWMFGAYGTSNKYFTTLANITDNINDNLMVKTVIFIQKDDRKTDKNAAPWHKVLQEQVKKHWIGVVIGLSALLTMVIVATVYLCSRKGKLDNGKKIKMTFYKDDEDDEARVAFLHSRT